MSFWRAVMSSSCRDRDRLPNRGRQVPALGGVLLTALVGPAAMAADVHVQPGVELRAENHTNRSLQPEGSENDESSYRAELGALLGIRTPRANTVINPRVRMQYNPDRKDDKERVDAFLELTSDYRSERSTFEIVGRYDHQDLADAELDGAEFDDVDPDDPTAPQTGRATVGQSRDRIQVRPGYHFDVTERFGLGVAATYEAVRYETNQAFRRVDYDYGIGEGFLTWAFTPKTEVSLGGYASRYENADFSLTTDAVGASLKVDHRWTPELQALLDLRYERNDFEEIDAGDPEMPLLEGSSTDWSAFLTGVWQGEISSVRLAAGRIFTPGGEGVKKESDQFRIEYKRAINPRLRFTGALRYTQDRPLRLNATENFREYLRGEIKFDRSLSRVWYLSGGYRYTWQEYRADPGPADDHWLFIGFGYRGLSFDDGRDN
jgi:hypothetical protein